MPRRSATSPRRSLISSVMRSGMSFRRLRMGLLDDESEVLSLRSVSPIADVLSWVGC